MKIFFTLSNFPLRALLLTLVTALLLSGCSPAMPTQATAEPIVINTLHDLQSVLKEIDQAEPVAAQARAEELWQSLVKEGRVPLILGTQVFFVYKGDADQVNWLGSFNGWNAPGVEGYRVGETDLWLGTIEFPKASRAEYKILLNGNEWVVDPANPHKAFSGLTGENNVVALPGFSVTDASNKRSDVTPGTLSESQSIESVALGYPVNYWVYTPGGIRGHGKPAGHLCARRQ